LLFGEHIVYGPQVSALGGKLRLKPVVIELYDWRNISRTIFLELNKLAVASIFCMKLQFHRNNVR
jgi:hypothetical protein